MDGVIVDSEPWWLVAMDARFSAAGVNLSPEDFRATTGLRLDQVIEYWYARRDFGDKNAKELESEIYDEVLRLVTENSELMPGLLDALRDLKSNNIPIGLASSSSLSLIEGILSYFQIADYFDAIFSAEGLEYGKPHPEVFLRAANQLNVTDTLHAIVIEDSLNGLVAAKSARMRCVVMPDPEKKELMQFSLADMMISSLTELKGNWWEALID